MVKKNSPRPGRKTNPKKEFPIQIWVAIITALAGISVAIINNWQNILPTATPSPASETEVEIAFDVDTGCPLGMVPVAEGYFLMGSTADDPIAKERGDEGPQRKIYLDKFCIHIREVSIGEYKDYIKKGGGTVSAEQEGLADVFPAVYISWDDARDFCTSNGFDLPSEAQWEKAARGTDTRVYPWGNEPWSPSLANCCQAGNDLMPADSFSGVSSPYGAINMAGNAAEWVLDWYVPDRYAFMESINPVPPELSETLTKVNRGGHYFSDTASVRTTARDGTLEHNLPGSQLRRIGFRCVYMPESP
jgi:formylglycine-generating enzyme required for sulfatase activity